MVDQSEIDWLYKAHRARSSTEPVEFTESGGHKLIKALAIPDGYHAVVNMGPSGLGFNDFSGVGYAITFCLDKDKDHPEVGQWGSSIPQACFFVGESRGTTVADYQAEVFPTIEILLKQAEIKLLESRLARRVR